MIELRPFSEADFPTLIGWIDSPEFLLQWGGPGFSYPLDQSQLRQLLRATMGKAPNTLAFTAVDDESGEIVGHIELLGIDRKNGSARIGRVLVGPPRLRGRGLGTRIMQAILRIGFEQLALRRIDLYVFDFNESAIACYEKVGFHKERHLKDARKIGEEYWSLWEMCLLEDEWRAASRADGDAG